MYNRITRIALALAALTGLAACGDSNDGTGQLTVQLTDAPFPHAEVDRVDMKVVRIDARIADASESDADTDIDSDTDGDIDTDTDGTSREGGWVTVAAPNSEINLLELQNGTVRNLGVATLPTGCYRGFRLVLDTENSSVTLKGGQELTGANGGIKFPSAHRTGIKVNLAEPICVTENGTVMVIDFDVSNSFVMRGNDIRNNGLLFKPVLRATARDITGSVSGVVRLDSPTGAVVPSATVQALKQGTVVTDTVTANIVATTVTDANGAFKFGFLLPGTYELRAIAPTGSGYKDALLTGGVVVAEDQDVTDKVIVLTK